MDFSYKEKSLLASLAITVVVFGMYFFRIGKISKNRIHITEISLWNGALLKKCGYIYTESWDVCLNLQFEIFFPIIIDALFFSSPIHWF